MQILRTRIIYNFVVKRAFMYSGKRIEPGTIIQVKDQIEADGYVQRGLLVPTDIPKIGVYVALQPLTLPGGKEAFKCEKLDLIELTESQALELMLAGAVIPKSPDQGRPRNMHLRQPGSETKERQQRERLEQAAFEQKLWDAGIHPAQKKAGK